MVSRADIFCETFRQMLDCFETVRGRGLYADLNWMQKELEEFLILKGERRSQTFGDLPLCERVREQLSPLSLPFPQLTYLLICRDALWRDRPGYLYPRFQRDLSSIKDPNPLDLGVLFLPLILTIWQTWYFSSAVCFT